MMMSLGGAAVVGGQGPARWSEGTQEPRASRARGRTQGDPLPGQPAPGWPGPSAQGPLLEMVQGGRLGAVVTQVGYRARGRPQRTAGAGGRGAGGQMPLLPLAGSHHGWGWSVPAAAVLTVCPCHPVALTPLHISSHKPTVFLGRRLPLRHSIPRSPGPATWPGLLPPWTLGLLDGPSHGLGHPDYLKVQSLMPPAASEKGAGTPCTSVCPVGDSPQAPGVWTDCRGQAAPALGGQMRSAGDPREQELRVGSMASRRVQPPVGPLEAPAEQHPAGYVWAWLTPCLFSVVESPRDAEEGVGRRRLSLPRPEVRPGHVQHLPRGRAVLVPSAQERAAWPRPASQDCSRAGRGCAQGSAGQQGSSPQAVPALLASYSLLARSLLTCSSACTCAGGGGGGAVDTQGGLSGLGSIQPPSLGTFTGVPPACSCVTAASVPGPWCLPLVLVVGRKPCGHLHGRTSDL